MVMLIGFISAPVLGLVAVLALLLFGNRIPSVMRSLGQGVTEFKKGMKELEDGSSTDSAAETKSAK